MKQYLLISLFSMLLVTASCSDWLDVNPVTEIRESGLFEHEQGYKDALTGVYIRMSDGTLYGKALSMYFPEMMAHTWRRPEETLDPTAYYLFDFDYANANVEASVSALWGDMYACIAQLNNILYNIEHTDVAFQNDNKELISGEAYGLRAFLHLDLLRLFGPVPGRANNNASCIPYVTEMTTDVAKLKSVSYEKVIEYIKEDLKRAEDLLKNEPAVKTIYSLDAAKTDDEIKLNDGWQYYRQLRFNYWAALGTWARLYYWTGEKEEAVKYALKVIGAGDEKGNTLFTLADVNDFSGNANKNMKPEHLFGVYNSSFNDQVMTYYTNAVDQLFTQEEGYVTAAYETGSYPDDVRYKDCWGWKQADGSTSTIYQYMKYAQAGSPYGQWTVPLLRLSEMYFILFEYESAEVMKPHFVTWRLARGLDSSIDNTLTGSENALLSRMEKEWRKEFFGEGQLFYFYKKHAYTSYTWPMTYELPSLDAYTIPKPKSQTSFE